ncbi:hypothetical protein E2320_011768 [Naja naja]|nr:hypothetical protein E2320_011768 [Naja naja]
MPVKSLIILDAFVKSGIYLVFISFFPLVSWNDLGEFTGCSLDENIKRKFCDSFKRINYYYYYYYFLLDHLSHRNGRKEICCLAVRSEEDNPSRGLLEIQVSLKRAQDLSDQIFKATVALMTKTIGTLLKYCGAEQPSPEEKAFPTSIDNITASPLFHKFFNFIFKVKMFTPGKERKRQSKKSVSPFLLPPFLPSPGRDISLCSFSDTIKSAPWHSG